MAVTSIRITDELKEEIEMLARLEGKSAHAFMVDAVEEKVASARSLRAFLAEGRAALEEFERTGEAIEAADMRRWLDAKTQGSFAAEPRRRRWRT